MPSPSGRSDWLGGSAGQRDELQLLVDLRVTLGFRHAVVPTGSRADAPVPDGLDVIEVGSVAEAIETMRRLAMRRTAPALTRDTA